MWTDSHCHVDGDAVAPAREAGVTRLGVVGTDASWAAAAIAVAN
ncbi:MAG: hypothetical protein QOK20_3113, partial [Acidimicrobiaceae bacterium]|nr:hypothetical protein [Acidimicrobiaceae bacterium]